jgi:hypothetical protein
MYLLIGKTGRSWERHEIQTRRPDGQDSTVPSFRRKVILGELQLIIPLNYLVPRRGMYCIYSRSMLVLQYVSSSSRAAAFGRKREGIKEGRKEQHNKGGRFESVDLTALGEEKALPLLLPSTHPKNLM